MKIHGEIELRRDIRGRWHIIEIDRFDAEKWRKIGRPEGYRSHFEGARWRKLYRRVSKLQRS